MKFSKAIQRLVNRAERALTGRSGAAKRSRPEPKTLRGEVALRQRQRVLPVPGLFGKWRSLTGGRGEDRTILYASGPKGDTIGKAVVEKAAQGHYTWDVCDEYEGCKAEGFARDRVTAQAHAESALLKRYAGKARRVPSKTTPRSKAVTPRVVGPDEYQRLLRKFQAGQLRSLRGAPIHPSDWTAFARYMRHLAEGKLGSRR